MRRQRKTAAKKAAPKSKAKEEEVEDEEELDESEDLKPKTAKAKSFIKEKQDDDDDEEEEADVEDDWEKPKKMIAGIPILTNSTFPNRKGKSQHHQKSTRDDDEFKVDDEFKDLGLLMIWMTTRLLMTMIFNAPVKYNRLHFSVNQPKEFLNKMLNWSSRFNIFVFWIMRVLQPMISRSTACWP